MPGLLTLFQRKRTRPRGTGCYGKLPFHSDFLRHNAAFEEVEILDRWLRAGLLYLQKTFGPAWEALFDAAPPCRMYYSVPANGRMIAASFHPALDRVGRRYPFLLFRVETFSGNEAGIGPFVAGLEAFFDASLDAFQEGRTARTRAHFFSKVSEIDAGRDIDYRPEAYRSWLQGNTSRLLFRRLFGSETEARRGELLSNLASKSRFTAEQCVLRFPPMAAPGDAAFFVDVAEARLAGPRVPRLLLYNEPTSQLPPTPILVLGGPKPEDILLLLRPLSGARRVRDLVSRSFGPAVSTAGIPAFVKGSPGAPDLPLSSLRSSLLRI